jgi:hypothetical protein
METKLLIILESLENKGDINSEIDLSETGYTPKVIKEALQSLGYKMVSGSWDCYDFSEEYEKEGASNVVLSFNAETFKFTIMGV